MYIVYSPCLLPADDREVIAKGIDWLRQHDARNALGFIPIQGIRDQIRRDRVLCLADTDDGDHLGGFVIWCKNRETLRILGICVPEDYRQQGRGRAMMEALLRHPATRKCTTLSLRCAVDLDSNHFWQRLGMKCV